MTLIAASGCAGTRWSVVEARPLMAIAVAPAELGGRVDKLLVAQRRAAMIGQLRARGYQVLDKAPPGVPTLTMKVDGRIVDDSQLHAPDDPRHNIYNDLHYQFVAYTVHLDVVDGGGHIVACGSASSNMDPATAVAELTAHLVHDLPAAPSTYAAR
ncbi:MAG: hypothetical protein ACXVCV_24980 [Polyangia bacterium]